MQINWLIFIFNLILHKISTYYYKRVVLDKHVVFVA